MPKMSSNCENRKYGGTPTPNSDHRLSGNWNSDSKHWIWPSGMGDYPRKNTTDDSKRSFSSYSHKYHCISNQLEAEEGSGVPFWKFTQTLFGLAWWSTLTLCGRRLHMQPPTLRAPISSQIWSWNMSLGVLNSFRTILMRTKRPHVKISCLKKVMDR